MNTFIMISIIIALFLLYRIAYPKHQNETKACNDAPCESETDLSEVIVKKRYVRTTQSQPPPTPATPEKDDVLQKNAYIFAAGNEKRKSVIPNENLDEVFGDESEDVNPEDLDLDPDEDYNDDETVDAEEEAEEFRLKLGRDAELASGFSIEEMSEAAKAIDKPTDEKAKILYYLYIKRIKYL